MSELKPGLRAWILSSMRMVRLIEKRGDKWIVEILDSGIRKEVEESNLEVCEGEE